jgi:hypothetical protein
MTKKRQRPLRKTGKARLPEVSHAQAADVLRKYAERLRKQGAHAMSIKPDSTRGHIIEVYIPEDFRGTLPSKVGVTVKGKKLDLRIKTKKAPRFKPEKL